MNISTIQAGALFVPSAVWNKNADDRDTVLAVLPWLRLC